METNNIIRSGIDRSTAAHHHPLLTIHHTSSFHTQSICPNILAGRRSVHQLPASDHDDEDEDDDDDGIGANLGKLSDSWLC